jgi:glycosyltransferase involved in cell wall biosynthesis
MKVLILPNEPLEEYEKGGRTFAQYPYRWFNPAGAFEEVAFSYVGPRSDSRKRGIFTISRSRSYGLFNPLTHIVFFMRTLRLARRFRPDLIRCYNPQMEGAVGVLIGRILGVPTVISYHNDYWYERRTVRKTLPRRIAYPVYSLLEKIANKGSSAVFCVSTHLKSELMKRGLSDDKVHVVFNKITMEDRRASPEVVRSIRKKYSLTPGKTFLFVGRLVEQKNLFRLLEATKKVLVNDPNIKLLLIGDGVLRGDIERWISRNELGSTVHLVGFVRNDQLREYFSASDYFVLPSIYEGFGVVLIESQYASVPVLSSDIPSVRDIVSPDNALLFNPLDTEDIALKMQTAISKPSLMDSLAIAAKRSVEKFSWNAVAKRETDLYTQLTRVRR